MHNLRISKLLSGGIITNYNCPSSCAHCLYRCGPHRSRDYLDYQTAITIFRTIREFDCDSVHIGGGEPLLDPRKLELILQAAGECRIGIDYVETNAAWYKDEESAVKTLESLAQNGLKALLVSISPFHNAQIPFFKTKGAIQAAQKTGLTVIPWTRDFIEDLNTLDQGKTHSLQDFLDNFGQNYILDILNRYWIHFGGRALDTFRPWFPAKSAHKILQENERSCARELLQTSHFHIDLYGNYIPGLCSGLAFNFRQLGKSLPPEEYPLLTALFNKGIRGLLDIAVLEFDFQETDKGYLNKCDLCNHIRHFLAGQNKGLEFKELKPLEFYLP